MSFKDTWIDQDETMDASPEVVNSIARAVIKNEEDIAEIKENGGTGGGGGESEVYIITGTLDFLAKTITTTATYAEIKAAVKANKVVVLNLIEGSSTIYVFSLHNIENAFAYFAATDSISVRSVLCTNTNEWSYSVSEHESPTNKKTIIYGNETNDRQYPSVPAVIAYVSTAIGEALEGDY